MKNIAVLVSGGGTNLQALIDAGIEIKLVISSRADAYALTRAKENNIKTEVVSWAQYKPDRKAFSAEILRLLTENNIDLVVYAGFMVILDECVVKAFPSRMINVHPSLLPAFGGEGFYGIKVHEAALKRGVKLSGATVHFVNEICDGGEILMQKAVEVHENETPETLQKRVMEVEREILPEAVKRLIKTRSKS
ncbi:MAG: phosphoribosylglycinamide formyltransferase [Oscillospiraceae bacterium]|jgi:phosphoribosylglycinamide formyltransferase-1|nr:phosphoribosylglycinamide formyltransferase [Oscillospiraceae bacterium]